MRPHRFTPLLAAAVNRDGRLTARTYEQAGVSRSRWGIVVTGPGVAFDVQVAARSAPNDRYDQPEGQPVTGPDCAPLDEVTPVDLASCEAYLAGLAVRYAADEIRSVTLYSQRGIATANPYGATIEFYDGSAVYLYVRLSGAAMARFC